jgi:PAS domain S-box-containing protein
MLKTLFVLLIATGRFFAVNPAVAKLWGYSDEDLIGDGLDAIVHEDDVKATFKAIDELGS